jgi:hypothetical protein
LDTNRNLAISSQGSGKDIQVGKDRSYCISPIAQQSLNCLIVVLDELQGKEERSMTNCHKILEEAFTRVNKSRVWHYVERSPQANLMSR